MRTNTILLAGLLLLAGACKPDPRQAETEPAPKTSEEYTLAIIREVQKVILSTDQQLREYQPQTRELPAEEGQQPRTLQLWTEGGNAVRLTATEPDESGQMQGLSSYYFANGELFFASQPYARFIFIGKELKYWLDEDWKVVQAPEEGRREREGRLLGEAERYLGAFAE